MGKKIIIIALAVVLLGAGGGAYVLLPAHAAEEVAVDAKAAAKKEAAKDDESEVESMTFRPAHISVIRDNRPTMVLTVTITVDLVDGVEKTTLKRQAPRLANAIVTSLTSLADLEWPDGRLLDLRAAKRILLKRFERVLGQEVIADLRFDSVEQRVN